MHWNDTFLFVTDSSSIQFQFFSILALANFFNDVNKILLNVLRLNGDIAIITGPLFVF